MNEVGQFDKRSALRILAFDDILKQLISLVCRNYRILMTIWHQCVLRIDKNPVSVYAIKMERNEFLRRLNSNVKFGCNVKPFANETDVNQFN